MGKNNLHTLSLDISAVRNYLPVVVSFVEAAAGVFGLKKEGYLRLSLATEEIFLYLCGFVCPGENLSVQCFNEFYRISVHFRFSAGELNLSGLNIASGSAPESDANLDDMGLLIASRSVDYLKVVVERDNSICLTITKEKDYPAAEEKMPLPEPVSHVFTEVPDAERLKCFAVMTAQYYALPYRPSFFTYPGKLVDMVATGEYNAIVAQNQKKEIVGGMLLRNRTEKIVQCFGPYCFLKEQEKEISEVLFHACIGVIARTKALGLLSLWGIPETLHNNFEPLGTLRYQEAGKAPIEEISFYRLLHEDPGFEVWSSASLADYLRREYRRLALAREIRVIKDMGETRRASSLFSAEVYRDQSSVTLRPLLTGNDFGTNLQRHIRFLKSDNFLNIYFELDLGVSWHAEMMDPLLSNNFKPAIIMPFAGKSDLVIFQHYDET